VLFSYITPVYFTYIFILNNTNNYNLVYVNNTVEKQTIPLSENEFINLYNLYFDYFYDLENMINQYSSVKIKFQTLLDTLFNNTTSKSVEFYYINEQCDYLRDILN
jgi:hypothetical protein